MYCLVLILIVTSRISEKIEFLEVQNFEYLENGARLFHETKQFLNCVSETAFYEVIFF